MLRKIIIFLAHLMQLTDNDTSTSLPRCGILFGLSCISARNPKFVNICIKFQRSVIKTVPRYMRPAAATDKEDDNRTMANRQHGSWHQRRSARELLRHIRLQGKSLYVRTCRDWRCRSLTERWRHPEPRPLTWNCWPPAWLDPDRTGAARWLVDLRYQYLTVYYRYQ